MITWIKEKWKILASAVVVLIGILLTLFRINSNNQSQKKILSKANESHKKELQTIKDAKIELDKGLKEIAQEEKKALDLIKKEEAEKTSSLQKEKKDFVDKQENSKDLAKNLANAIGADFVDSSND